MTFVDTSFWVALLVPRDARHDTARELWTADQRSLATSNHVIGETWTFLRRRAGHGPAVAFVDAVAAARRVAVVQIDESTEAEALEWLRRHDEREYSFVDATSFALMRRRRWREAFAFDGDFTAVDLVELRP